MSGYQMIAFDMDGTLLNSQKKITPATREMIERAILAGKEVILSTGRCMAELQEYLPQLPGLRYVVSASGALVYDRKKRRTLYTKRLEEPFVRKLLEAGRQEDAMVHFLTEESIVQQDQVDHMDTYGMGIYQQLFQRLTRKVEDIYAFYEENPRPLEKLNLYHRTLESRERTRERLKGLGLCLVDAELTALECSAPGVTKGTGLLKLCQCLGMDPGEVIAVGDADNDRDMLKVAGLSIAMGNARPAIQSLCDRVVADCDHDGCAEAIERYLLGSLS